MTLSQRELDAYRDHLAARGLSPGTQKVYCSHVRSAHAEADLLDRLRGGLSPLAKRLCKASLLSWAKFKSDTDLRDQLEDIRLPPARRKKPKQIFSKPQWRAFRDSVDTVEHDAMRATLGLMTFRGLRVGDALRLRRTEVTSALKTGSLVHAAKGQKYLEFGVTRAFREPLEVLADHEGWKDAFSLVSPTPGSASNRMRYLVDQLGEEIGFSGAHPHLLRSTYATYFYYACEKDLVALQDHMQWSNLETARKYVVQHNREELDQIAERMFDEPDDES